MSGIQYIGPHRVRHGNVMDSAGIAQLMGNDLADIYYSDPPWGKGNLNFWSTKNRKDTGQEVVQPELSDFLDHIFTMAAKYTRGIFLLEYGTRWDGDIISRASRFGFTNHGYCTPVYGKPARPLHLFLFANRPISVPAGYFQSLDNTTGFETVKRATAPFAKPGGIAVDLCCGLGYTAKMALYYGMKFRGNELNSARLAETIKKLEAGVKKASAAAVSE